MKWLIALCLSCCLTLVWADSKRPTPSSDAKHALNAELLSVCGDYCDEKPESPLTCGDYLKQLGRARSDITYIGCKAVMLGAQKLPGFEAEYRVKGKDIAKVDNWLTTWAEWKCLRFSCCQWDAPRGYYRDPRGSGFEIDMFADAYVNGHMVDDRKNFAKLPFATLTVTHFVYRP